MLSCLHSGLHSFVHTCVHKYICTHINHINIGVRHRSKLRTEANRDVNMPDSPSSRVEVWMKTPLLLVYAWLQCRQYNTSDSLFIAKHADADRQMQEASAYT